MILYTFGFILSFILMAAVLWLSHAPPVQWHFGIVFYLAGWLSALIAAKQKARSRQPVVAERTARPGPIMAVLSHSFIYGCIDQYVIADARSTTCESADVNNDELAMRRAVPKPMVDSDANPLSPERTSAPELDLPNHIQNVLPPDPDVDEANPAAHLGVRPSPGATPARGTKRTRTTGPARD